MPSQPSIQEHVITYGTLYRAPEEVVARFKKRLELQTAERGVALVRINLHRVLKHPTGHYESSIAVASYGTLTKVWDSMVVYGSWLEGTSSRNQTTRFKGYTTFRRTTQELQREVDSKSSVYAAELARELSV